MIKYSLDVDAGSVNPPVNHLASKSRLAVMISQTPRASSALHTTLRLSTSTQSPSPIHIPFKAVASSPRDRAKRAHVLTTNLANNVPSQVSRRAVKRMLYPLLEPAIMRFLWFVVPMR
jgi:hypothetical protein